MNHTYLYSAKGEKTLFLYSVCNDAYIVSSTANITYTKNDLSFISSMTKKNSGVRYETGAFERN